MKLPFLIASMSLLITSGLAVGFGAGGQESKTTPDPYRAFDFWVGEWDCFSPNGQLGGTNTITLGHAGKVLQEHWVGAGGGTGTSLNIYDKRSERWHQTWVDAGGTLLLLDGNLTAAGAMRMEGRMLTPTGEDALHRIEWTPSEGNVRQVWTMSLDEGGSWKTLADLMYKPAKTADHDETEKDS